MAEYPNCTVVYKWQNDKKSKIKQTDWMIYEMYGIWVDGELFFMPPPLDARGIMFSGCPSVRPKPEIPSFDL